MDKISEDRTGLSRLEDEVARLEKQLSGLDPLAMLAMDAVLDEDMSNMTGLSITSDGDASADAGFADMEREMMNQLAWEMIGWQVKLLTMSPRYRA